MRRPGFNSLIEQLGLQYLISCYFAYEDEEAWPSELPFEVLGSARRESALNMYAVKKAKEWLVACSA